MYGTKGHVGPATVEVVVVVPVAVVVVAPELVVGAVVVVAPELVVGAVVVVAPELVVGAVVVAPELVAGAVVVPPVVVAVEELSLVCVVEVWVVSENVLPTVIGERSPSAPETSTPSANTAASPTASRILRRYTRRFTGVPPMSVSSPDSSSGLPLAARPLLPSSHRVQRRMRRTAAYRLPDPAAAELPEGLDLT
jgi:hypothetical protein